MEETKAGEQQARTQCYCERIVNGINEMGKETSEFFTKLGKDIGPSDNVKQHFRTASIEFWKGVRAMVDEKIEHLTAHPGAQKGTTVAVD